MEELLTQIGLSQAESLAYLYLLAHGTSSPPEVAKGCRLTRSNAYKVLDSLQTIGLTVEKEKSKKIVFEPVDPSALAGLVAEQRNQVTTLEHNVKTAMTQLRDRYRRGNSTSQISQDHGSDAIIAAFTDQADNQAPVYFIKSRADIPFMGFETMDKIRHLPARYSSQRHGITPDTPEVSPDSAGDRRTNLDRRLVSADSYTAPVEWSVAGDELLIIKYDGEGTTIRLADAEIAESFRQIWQLAAPNPKKP